MVTWSTGFTLLGCVFMLRVCTVWSAAKFRAARKDDSSNETVMKDAPTLLADIKNNMKQQNEEVQSMKKSLDMISATLFELKNISEAHLPLIKGIWDNLLGTSNPENQTESCDMLLQRAVNVAIGKPTNATVARDLSEGPGNAVDGNRQQPYVSVRYFEQPWWTVDLEKKYRIMAVKVTAPPVFPWRVHDIDVRVGSIPVTDAVSAKKNNLCFHQVGAATKDYEAVEERCGECGIIGRYVSIQIIKPFPGEYLAMDNGFWLVDFVNYLHIMEVEIKAVEA